MSTTTSTTTQEPETTTTTTVEKQGEVQIDKSADAHVLKEQSAEDRTRDAQDLALANHAAEHQNDEGDVTSRDKTDDDK